MKTHKLLIPIVALALLASACNKDKSQPSLSKAQAQAAISDVNTNLANDVSDLKTSAGTTALTSFTNLTSTTSPFARMQSFNKPGEIKEAMTAGLISIRQMVIGGTGGEKTQSSESFNFAGKVGIYNYDFGQQKFVKSQETSTIIIIRYPKDDASKANSTNDAELQITEFTDTYTPQGYNPTSVKAAIYISSVKQASLTLVATYDDAGDPNAAKEELFINPFTISFGFDNTPPTSASEWFSLSKSGTTLIGLSASAVWASALDKGNGRDGNPPKTLTGSFQLKNLVFNVIIDGTKASNNPNDFVVITVTADGVLAGHVVWVTDQNGDQPYMQYNDKNQEPLSTIFDKLGTQIEGLFNG